VKTQIISLALIFSILLAGCQGFGQTSVPTATIMPAETIENLPQGLTVNDFKNYAITSLLLDMPIQLKDGIYESGSGANYELLQLMNEAAFDDLNGDGNEDAALLLAESGGGSGVFVYLVAMVKQAEGYSQSIPLLIDDRPQINSVSIENNKIQVDALIHGMADAMANPTMAVKQEYQLMHSKLILTRLDSTISSAERSISIESPVDGSELSGAFNVKGSMPIGPFENNLVYRFFDSAGILLNEGPFPVQSDGVGGAATFDTVVTLPDATPGTVFLFVLAELSMADGRYLCLDSVNVVLK